MNKTTKVMIWISILWAIRGLLIPVNPEYVIGWIIWGVIAGGIVGVWVGMYLPMHDKRPSNSQPHS